MATRTGTRKSNPALARWLASAQERGRETWLAGRDGLLLEQLSAEFQRQAIAAIDHVTTDCCLRAHGQIVGMEELFQLTGTPRPRPLSRTAIRTRIRGRPRPWPVAVTIVIPC